MLVIKDQTKEQAQSNLPNPIKTKPTHIKHKSIHTMRDSNPSKNFTPVSVPKISTPAVNKYNNKLSNKSKENDSKSIQITEIYLTDEGFTDNNVSSNINNILLLLLEIINENFKPLRDNETNNWNYDQIFANQDKLIEKTKTLNDKFAFINSLETNTSSISTGEEYESVRLNKNLIQLSSDRRIEAYRTSFEAIFTNMKDVQMLLKAIKAKEEEEMEKEKVIRNSRKETKKLSFMDRIENLQICLSNNNNDIEFIGMGMKKQSMIRNQIFKEKSKKAIPSKIKEKFSKYDDDDFNQSILSENVVINIPNSQITKVSKPKDGFKLFEDAKSLISSDEELDVIQQTNSNDTVIENVHPLVKQHRRSRSLIFTTSNKERIANIYS